MIFFFCTLFSWTRFLIFIQIPYSSKIFPFVAHDIAFLHFVLVGLLLDEGLDIIHLTSLVFTTFKSILLLRILNLTNHSLKFLVFILRLYHQLLIVSFMPRSYRCCNKLLLFMAKSYIWNIICVKQLPIIIYLLLKKII